MNGSRNGNCGKIKRALLAALAFGLASAAPAFAGGGGESRYYVNDHLATTVGITDAAGEIAAIEADAFGSSMGGGEVAGHFTGKPYDADLGAYVFPFRNYRADEARWMSADPSGFPDGVNAMRYAAIPNGGLDVLGLASFRGPSSKPGKTSKTEGSYTYTVSAGAVSHINAVSLALPAWTNSPAEPWTVSNGGARDGSFSVTSYKTLIGENERLSVNMEAVYDGVMPDVGYQYAWIQMHASSYSRGYVPDVSDSSALPFYPLGGTSSLPYAFRDTPGFTVSWLEGTYNIGENGSFKWDAKLYLVQYNLTARDIKVHDGMSWALRISRE